MSPLAISFLALMATPLAAGTPEPVAQDRPAPVSETLQTALDDLHRDLPQLAEPGERAEAWGRLAMLYHAQDLLDEAEGAYRRALAEKPALRWHYLLAVVLGERGDTQGAIAAYRHALTAASNGEGGHALSSYRLGLLHLLEGDHRAAATALGEAHGGMPDSAAVLAALADAAVGVGDWQQAKSLLERAAALEPNAGRIAYKLALAHRHFGDLEKARYWLAKRNATAPAVDDPLLLEVAQLSLSAKFFVKAGERAWQRGERLDALAAWRNAVALAPDDVDTGLVYAHALGALGQREAAVEEARRVLAIDPQSARGWYVLALQLRTEADAEEAIDAAQRAAQLAGDATARTLLAALMMRAGNFDEAAAIYHALAGEHVDAAYYRYWLGMARLAAGECQAARRPLEEALERQANWGQAHVALARADALCGNSATRLAAYAKAKGLLAARADADTRITLAFAELGLGRADAARQRAAAAMPHDDARMLLAALAKGKLPARPFAADSGWWLPAELR